MVRVTVLASGSRGNCTVVTGGRTSVLVDAGLSCRELGRRMLAVGEDPRKLDAILITHEHQDHVQGLSVLARRLGIPVYFTEATHRAWMRSMVPQRRMSYAAWLAGRKAEAAHKAAAAKEAGQELGQELGQQPAPADASVRGAAPKAAPGTTREAAPETAPEAAPETTPETTPQAAPQTAPEATFDECAEEAEAFAAFAASPTTLREGVPHALDGLCAGEAAPARPDPCQLPAVEYFQAGKRFAIGDLEITPFTIPHDAADPVGFVLGSEGLRIGLATDLGYLPANVSQQLRRCDLIMLESNHDLEMLRDGPYPWSVKQRVLSRVGHLSNAAAADFLEKGYDGQAAYVVLAHLSESNNLPELARVAAEWALRDRMQLLANKLVIAGQHQPTEPICL